MKNMKIELTEQEKYQIYREMVNQRTRERKAKRTPEQVEADRIRHREYMREWARNKRAQQKEV